MIQLAHLDQSELVIRQCWKLSTAYEDQSTCSELNIKPWKQLQHTCTAGRPVCLKKVLRIQRTNLGTPSPGLVLDLAKAKSSTATSPPLICSRQSRSGGGGGLFVYTVQ